MKMDKCTYSNRILIRRQARAKLMLEGKIPKERERKKYLHESRHLHAMNRARGNAGKFDAGAKDDNAPPKKGKGVDASSLGRKVKGEQMGGTLLSLQG